LQERKSPWKININFLIIWTILVHKKKLWDHQFSYIGRVWRKLYMQKDFQYIGSEIW
jgi:hypothetical protein